MEEILINKTMKRVVITGIALIISISFCFGQGIQEAVKKQQQQQEQQEQQQKEAEEKRQNEAKQRQAIEEQRRRDLETSYQNAMTSAQQNFDQQKYAQAKQDYLKARELKPESATTINTKIAEIDKILLEEENELAEAKRELRYQNAIKTAQQNLNQRQYAQAIQDYTLAREIKPEETAFIDTKIAEIEKLLSEPALLNIYRKRKPIEILPKRYDILMENVVVGTSTNNWKTTVTVNTFGLQTISSTIDGRKAEVQINFEPGNVYYLRSDVSSKTVETGEIKTYTDKNGKVTTRKVTEIQYTPILQLVDKSVGESEFNAIKEK